MPQLDVLIWMNLVLNTTICFWGIYYILIRLFLLNYQFILNLRLKFKNNFFNLVYVLLVLIFNYNFQNIKTAIKFQNLIQKKNYINFFLYTKCVNTFCFITNFVNFNIIFANIKAGNFVHILYYIFFYKKNI